MAPEPSKQGRAPTGAHAEQLVVAYARLLTAHLSYPVCASAFRREDGSPSPTPCSLVVDREYCTVSHAAHASHAVLSCIHCEQHILC